MSITNLKLLYCFAFLLCTVIACKTDIGETTTSGTDDSVDTVGDHEVDSDYVWDISSITRIVLNGSSISVNGSGASVTGSKVTITSSGNYSVTGTLTNGQVIVNTTDLGVVRLILGGVNITCSSSSPILVTDAAKVVINLAENTENFLTDGASYVTVDGEPNAAIFSKSNLSIFGSGKLTVVGKYLDGISSKDGLIIKSGTIAVTSVDDGIRGKDYLIIEDGNITVNSGGDGLKSDNEVYASKGYINITKGVFNIVSGGDAISARTIANIADGNFTITSGGGSSKTKSLNSAKGIKAVVSLTIETGTFVVSSADDALHSNGKITINAGSFALSTVDDGIHADAEVTINNGTINISKSYEGIESHLLTVNDGNISVTSSNDSFNATAGSRTEQDDKSFIYIYGGYMALSGTTGDPLDSNGSLVMTKGTVIVHGPTSAPEVAIDYNGSFNVSGGFLIASGTNSNMTQSPSTTSTQKSIQVMFPSSLAANTIFNVQDANGNSIATFKPVRKYQSMVVSSPLFVMGSTYKIYTSGSSTGTFPDGFSTDSTYTPGSLYKSFTITGSVTKL